VKPELAKDQHHKVLPYLYLKSKYVESFSSRHREEYMPMTKNPRYPRLRAAVRQVHLEQLEQDLVDLEGYRQALVVFRLRGAVVGQAWLPVTDSRLTSARLRSCLPALAWPVWQQLFAQDHDPAQPLPTASVVVCTRDRTDDLAQCLPGLSRLAAEGHEVIVVDNCPSDDRTARLMVSYPAIRYLREPRPGAGIARNHGLLAATREVVAFTDDDAQVDPGWLPALLRNFDDPLVAVVTGITMPSELETEAQMWFEQTNAFGRGFVRKRFDSGNLNPLVAGLAGASVNVAIRRSAVSEIGLFDEALGPGTIARCGEDHEFFYRALARGYRIVYDPRALVWHRHRREWRALQRTLYGYGVGVFAWWTRALLVEGELTLLRRAPSWFWHHHGRNLVRSLLRRPDHVPLDLAWAEFRGALAGPGSYLRSRRRLRRLARAAESSQKATPESDQTPGRTADHKPALVGQSLELR
jgi:GT2 family glycosyltransferase